ncbi:Methyl-accepting chemotaxis protein [Hyella patelloides LEGE 07179]|uniref:Methyl-accepting chemotaxis protein n=1 Tax=Hyella patelloides LEGE 07179 TaxID=945734 RepID=A0A563VMU7_9CYAN|nr:methyl-accepting chemotaxis protein [Hyella patelloides]VEP12741.1 Methyl-accepting chemotaxis protein [Hyella patelloides LEGE 07179]
MKIPFFQSLRFRMPVTLVFLGVIPPILIGIGFASFRATKIIHNDAEKIIGLETAKLQGVVSQWIEMNVLALKNLSEQPAIVSLDAQQQKPVLEKIVSNYEHLYLAITTDLNGMNLARSDNQSLKKYSDRQWFQGTMAGKDITYQSLTSRTTNKPAVCMSTPILQQKIVQGVTVICSSVDAIAAQVANINVGETGVAIIVDNNGQVVAHSNSELISGDTLVNLNNYPPVANIIAGNEGNFIFVDEAGIEWIAHGKLLDNDWAAITLQHTNEAFFAEQQYQQIAIASIVIVILITSILTSIIASSAVKPLINLTNVSLKVAEGDFSNTVKSDRDDEIGILADAFNQMAQQLQESFATLETKVNERTVQLSQAKTQLETAIYILIDEISDATEGDLTVRANLESVELGTVADLFNAIIGSLQEIAIEARQSTIQVENSLKQNESAIRLLAQQAIAETQETRKTLVSVQQMSQSIQEVAHNANQAEQIVDDTYKTVLNSTGNMDLTVDSILTLQTTVGESTKKMKRLGESSEKIAQALSFIEEIALKTNVLAINARTEAHRAGEYGQGFAVVAEQVSVLAEKCSTATQEIARIVTTIQAETQEVSQAMKSGTTQVAETTRLVESTKDSLNLVLEKSQAINQLMGSISQSTISQATTSQSVTSLMEKIAQLSETTSKSSQQVAKSIGSTAQVAAKLQSTVAQFKVTE